MTVVICRDLIDTGRESIIDKSQLGRHDCGVGLCWCFVVLVWPELLASRIILVRHQEFV